MKEFMTLQEFKEYFGIKDNKTVQSWEENGLKAIYMSNKRKYFYCEDIREFMLKMKK